MLSESFQVHDYRLQLTKELKSRLERNKNYSLRAFARDIDVSPAYLSQLLKGQKSLSLRKATSILKKLKWPYTQEKSFLEGVRYEHSESTSEEDDVNPGSEKQSYDEMSSSIFEMISRWHFGAILELISIPKLNQDPEWLADKLDVPVSEIVDALEILVKLGFLSGPKGELRRSSPHLKMKDIPSEAIRSYHRESLDRAKTAVEMQPPTSRYFSSVMFQFDSQRIKSVGEKIEKFRDELNKEESTSSGNSVYQLCLSFFRVDAGIEQ